MFTSVFDTNTVGIGIREAPMVHFEVAWKFSPTTFTVDFVPAEVEVGVIKNTVGGSVEIVCMTVVGTACSYCNV